MQTTTPKQENRAKNEARGMDALREQMRDLSKGREQETSIAAFKSIRSSLADRQLEVLFEFKHLGSQGGTAKSIAQIIGTEHHCVSGRVTELKKLGRLNRPDSFTNGRNLTVSPVKASTFYRRVK